VLVGTMRPLGQDGPPKVHNRLSMMRGVPEAQLCLSVDDARLCPGSPAAGHGKLLRTQWATRRASLNLAFALQIREVPMRVVHVAHDLDVTCCPTTSDDVPVQAEGSQGPRRAARRPRVLDCSRRRRQALASGLPPMYAHLGRRNCFGCHPFVCMSRHPVLVSCNR
jgi:hypothetical protein